MRRLLVASVALLTGLAVPANARPVGIHPAYLVQGEVAFGGAQGGVAWNGRCEVRALSQETLTGPTGYAAVLTGEMVAYYPASLAPANGTLECFVRVSGVRWPGAVGAGLGAAVAAGERAYFAEDTDTVDLCAEVDFGFGPIVDCGPTDISQVPPQEVLDLVDTVFADLVDPIVCPLLASLSPGVPPVVDINTEGDVSLASGKLVDCPPYDS